jgi:5-methylcytosine-specific restriction endonuclease McrA
MDFTCPHCDNLTPHTIEKYCPKCSQTLPHTAFHKNKAQPSGLSSWCKTCRNTHNKTPEQREKNNASLRKWNEGHREQVNANAVAAYYVMKEKREADPVLDVHLRALSRAKSRRAYARDPLKAISATASYAKTNKPKINKRRRERHAAQPEKARAWNSKRAAAKRNAPLNDLTADQWKAIQIHYGFRCVYCGKKPKELTMDHITPLSKGGAHTMSNVVPACRSCNAKKNDRAVLKPIQPLLL